MISKVWTSPGGGTVSLSKVLYTIYFVLRMEHQAISPTMEEEWYHVRRLLVHVKEPGVNRSVSGSHTVHTSNLVNSFP